MASDTEYFTLYHCGHGCNQTCDILKVSTEAHTSESFAVNVRVVHVQRVRTLDSVYDAKND